MKRKSAVPIGVVMVYLDFFPRRRDASGAFVYVEGLKRLIADSPVEIKAAQIPVFPGDITEENLPELRELVSELRELVPEVMFILMLTTDPLDPANEVEATETLAHGLISAHRLGVKVCSATSFEAWMAGAKSGSPPLTGPALESAIDLLVRIHANGIRRAAAHGCEVEHLDMEYLRTIEMTTFNNMEIALRVVLRINRELRRSFVRLLDDTAHAWDSGLALERQDAARKSAAEAGAYGTFHASEPTTRGVIGFGGSTKVRDGLESAARHGDLEVIMVELFDCEGETTAEMRDRIPGYGMKTYETIHRGMVDSIAQVAKYVEEFDRAGLIYEELILD